MYKVVLIDDEPVILKGMTKMIPWESYGCQVIATAEDGLEGLKMMALHQPDMIITDISMPGMDGLKMIAAIRSEYPNTVVSILTGFRDFDYAQQAIRLGVTRFLLKPSNMEDVQEAVETMCRKLDEMRQDERPKENKEIVEETILPTGNEAGSFIVDNAIAYMEKNYLSKMTLAEVADQCYVSQWHLSKLLNKHGGQSFSDILNKIRIREAKKLLFNPALRIGDIAEMVGFLDMAHFSRVFKKLEGVSANEYRNGMKKELK
ncbi:response regulator [Lachnospiraceae bacterium OttesenSCG-928-D06]|nr:response regulator [Lachnospiraceae bacterium OttesenSCG-928-D06]